MRVLFAGPVFPRQFNGGLALALADLANELSKRGWDVDETLGATGRLPPSTSSTRSPPRTPSTSSTHSTLSTPSTLPVSSTTGGSRRRTWHQVSNWRVWRAVPPFVRLAASVALAPRAHWDAMSNNLRALEAKLSGADRPDVVIVSVNASTPGAVALALARHPRVIVLSLDGIVDDVRRPGWLARLAGSDRHPFLLRPVEPSTLRTVVFASDGWKQSALGAGVPAERSSVVLFGVDVPQSLPPRRTPTGRLLWVGRLSPQKGLHFLIRALPAIRACYPSTTLTVIGGAGPAGYERAVRRNARRLGVYDIIEWQPPCERAALAAAYRDHDALFFHSVFDEPVALVLMEAFAAGLPVVASRPRVANGLLRHALTCRLVTPDHVPSMAEAIVAALGEPAESSRLAAAAFALVRDDYSLQAMGDAWDRLLRNVATRTN